MPVKLDARIGGDTLAIDADLTGAELVEVFRDWVNKVGLGGVDPAQVAKLTEKLNAGTEALEHAEANPNLNTGVT